MRSGADSVDLFTQSESRPASAGAINQYRLIKAHSQFKYRVAYTCIIGSAFWN